MKKEKQKMKSQVHEMKKHDCFNHNKLIPLLAFPFCLKCAENIIYLLLAIGSEKKSSFQFRQLFDNLALLICIDSKHGG